MRIATKPIRPAMAIILLLAVPLLLNASDGSKSRFIAADPSIALHLTFDGNLLDASNYNNNGSASNQSYTADHLGTPNAAYLFNGSSNFIVVPNNSTLNPAQRLTVTLWLRIDNIAGNYMPVFIKGGPVTGYFNDRQYSMHAKQNSNLWYPQLKSAGDGSGQHECDSDHHSYTVGEWVFFAFVVDRVSHVMQIYANGVLTEQTADSYSSFNINANPLLIGWTEELEPGHAMLVGAMDDFRLYARALSLSDIQTLYNGAEPPPPPQVPVASPVGLICLGILFTVSASWLVKRRGMSAV